jgi:outer membrane biosynthesis protein TonB
MATIREVTAHFDSARQREFRRFLVASALLHLGAFALLTAVPALPTVRPSGAIAVNLVAAPRPVRAVPAPRAAPKPKPKPPRPAPVVLPTEPTPPKPRPKPAPREEEPPEPEPVAEEDYGDVLDQLREELGEEAPAEPSEAVEPAQTAALGAGGTGPARPIPPEVARWLRDARIHVRRNWTLPGSFRMQSLVTEVEVDLDAMGNLKGTPRVARRSGTPWYDDGVVRSIQKASPLPAPPEAGAWTFVFASDEDL